MKKTQSDKVFIPNGILGIANGTISNIVIQKNKVCRIKSIEKKVKV